MPVYVYKNLETGEIYEIQQSMSEPALTEHPDTGAPVKRIVQPVGIAFKGSGFYVTDSRRGASKPASGASSDASTPSSEGGSGGSEGKAAASSPSTSTSTSTSGSGGAASNGAAGTKGGSKD